MKKVIIGAILCLLLLLIPTAVMAETETSLNVDVIADYGAAGDGVTDDRAAIQKAIDEMHAAGGGTVILTAGKTFLSGNIILRSNVTLYFGDGAVLKQNPDQNAYVKPEGDTLVSYTPDIGHNTIEGVRWGHSFFKNYPFVYAGEGTTNIKISGAGTIEMTPARNSDYTPAEFCEDTIHLCPLGLYRVSDFTVQDITITNSSAYGMMVFTCNNGLIKNITMKDFIHVTYDVDSHLNGDGISMQNCQDMRVTGCDLTVSDDALYIWTSYNDPRGGTWWSSENPQPSKNFEIDNNKTNTPCKGFGFILWGSSCPDQYKVEVSNVYVHDNTFSSLGIWPDDPHDTLTDPTPIKNIRFENNTIAKIQDNFYGVPVSNMSGYASMTEFMNSGFEDTETYWIIDKDESYAASAAGTSTYSCGQDGTRFGYMQNLVEGKNISIYQGLWLDSGRVYTFSAKLMTKGNTCRMFVRDLDTQEVIATQDFNNTAWEEKSLRFTVLNSGNYQLGIESGESTTGMARIDSANLTFEVDPTQTIFTTQIPDGFGSDNYYELGTRFTTSANGRVTKVRIYTTATESGIHYVRLWDYKNKTAITPVYEWDVPAGTEGWQEFTLPTPVSLSAGVDYVVAVSNNATNKIYPKSNSGLASQVTNGNLVAYAKGGLWSRTQGDMPYNQANTNYFRDIVFEATEQSIFSTEIPTDTDNDTFYELGTRFKTACDGYVTQVRIYTSADESGVHTVRLWDYQNKTLLAGPYEWDVPSGIDGWQYFTLPTPLPLDADTDYVVSVSNNASNKLYCKGDKGFASVIVSGDLSTYANVSGLWSRNAGDMPYNKTATNYFRDIVFVAEKADRAALQLAVDSCADLDESEYSADSWAALQEALSDAKTVLADPYTTQDQADEATTTLNAAIKALAAPAEPELFDLAGMTMSLGNSLAANFVVPKADLVGDGHYAVITKEYADGTSREVTVAQADWQAYGSLGYYFTFAGVNAKEMTDRFTVDVYNAEGVQVMNTYVRTIEDYCYDQIVLEEAKAEPAAKNLALYVDILKYGAAAQAFFQNYNIENLATAWLNETQLAYGAQEVTMTDLRVKGAGYLGSTLSLKNEISMNFVFSGDVIGKAAYATVSFTDHYGNAKEKRVEAADFQVYDASSKYIIVDGMAVADCSAQITVTLYDAADNALSVNVDSVESYIFRMTGADPLYETIMKLATSAYNYFH